MNKRFVFPLALALGLGLAACETPRWRDHGDKDIRAQREPDACKVHVHLPNNKILVDQEPTRTSRCAGSRVVSFILVGKPQATLFEVTIKPGGLTPAPVCTPVTGTPPGQREVRCDFTGLATGESRQFPYSIKVVDGGVTMQLDPMMVND